MIIVRSSRAPGWALFRRGAGYSAIAGTHAVFVGVVARVGLALGRYPLFGCASGRLRNIFGARSHDRSVEVRGRVPRAACAMTVDGGEKSNQQCRGERSHIQIWRGVLAEGRVFSFPSRRLSEKIWSSIDY